MTRVPTVIIMVLRTLLSAIRAHRRGEHLLGYRFGHIAEDMLQGKKPILSDIMFAMKQVARESLEVTERLEQTGQMEEDAAQRLQDGKLVLGVQRPAPAETAVRLAAPDVENWVAMLSTKPEKAIMVLRTLLSAVRAHRRGQHALGYRLSYIAECLLEGVAHHLSDIMFAMKQVARESLEVTEHLEQTGQMEEDAAPPLQDGKLVLGVQRPAPAETAVRLAEPDVKDHAKVGS